MEIKKLRARLSDADANLGFIRNLLVSIQSITQAPQHFPGNPNLLEILGAYDGQLGFDDITDEKWNWNANKGIWI